MKIKKLNFLLCILCFLLLSACTGRQDRTDKTKDNAAAQQSKKKEPPKSTAMDAAKEDIDLSNSFNGIQGCAVIYQPKNNTYSFYNASVCEQEVSPFSTFKIISALVGLEKGILKDETSTMNYSGSQYPIAEWNADLTLKDAFQTSCIWYFRQVIDALGMDVISSELNNLQYGNCDVSEWNGSGTNAQEELNGFWINSSLKISPLEQVQVLTEIFEGNTAFSDENVNILKNIMLVDESDHQKIYGKTGSDSNGQAWFVGFKEEQGIKEYFAVYLDDEINKEDISGNTAKEIALQIIK